VDHRQPDGTQPDDEAEADPAHEEVEEVVEGRRSRRSLLLSGREVEQRVLGEVAEDLEVGQHCVFDPDSLRQTRGIQPELVVPGTRHPERPGAPGIRSCMGELTRTLARDNADTGYRFSVDDKRAGYRGSRHRRGGRYRPV